MPRRDYRLKDGTRVPGVTTVIGQLGWGKEGLMYWAWKLGTEGKDYKQERQKACNIGTLVHRFIELDLKENNPDPKIVKAEYPEATQADINRALESYERNFVTWRKRNDFKVYLTEQKIVSEKYRYGGTIDCLGFLNGELVILDWKTSNSIYEDQLMQLATYKYGWEECHPDMPIEGGAELLQISKEIGKFTHHRFDRLPKWIYRDFLRLRRIYDDKKKFKAYV